MIPYLFVIFLLLSLHFSGPDTLSSRLSARRSKVKPIQKSVLVYVAAFLCAGYMCGSDWRSYEIDYYGFDGTDLVLEPGYYYLTVLTRNLGIGFWPFNIALKFLCLLAFYKFILRYYINDKYLVMLFFFSFYGIYLFIDAPLRNLCAITLFLLSLLLFEKRPLFALLLSLSGVFIHSSAIVTVPFFLILIYQKKHNVPTSIYLIVYIIAVILSFEGLLLARYANETVIGRLFWAEKLDRYVEHGFGAESTVSTAMSMGEMLKIFFFLLIITQRKKIECLPNGNILFLGVMFYFILSKLGASMNVLMRFGCYFSLYYAIVMTAMIKVINIKLRNAYRVALIVLSIMITTATITTDYRFVPYTNYFSYLLFHNTLPSYSERASYNYGNTPYK